MADVDGREYMADREDEAQRDAAAVELAVALVLLRRLASLGADTPLSEAYALASLDLARADRILEDGLSGVADAESAMLDGARDDCAEWAEGAFGGRGATVESASRALAPAFDRGARRARAQLSGWCRTSLLGVVRPDGGVMPCREAYMRTVDEAVRAARAGAAAREALLRGVVGAMGQHGLQVEYGSGRRMRLDSAVRMSFSDSMRDSVQEGRERVGDEFGADGYEISAHGNCAPDHEPYQGRRYRKEDFERLQRRLKRPIGTMNCRHTYRPVVMGSPRQHSERELRAMRESGRETVLVPSRGGGLVEATRYEATQMQRSIERSVRRMREREQMLRAAGLDADAKALRDRVRAERARYRELSVAAGVPQFPERMMVPKIS